MFLHVKQFYEYTNGIYVYTYIVLYIRFLLITFLNERFINIALQKLPHKSILHIIYPRFCGSLKFVRISVMLLNLSLSLPPYSTFIPICKVLQSIEPFYIDVVYFSKTIFFFFTNIPPYCFVF